MGFTEEKRQAVNNLRASQRVGDVDVDAIPVIDEINSLDCYYTTSSCSGRILLMQYLGGKGSDEFLIKWHRKASPDEVYSAIVECSGVLWFRYECPILHVMAQDVEAAASLLNAARQAGFKRSGIQSVKPGRVLVEILSTERIDTPIQAGGKMLVSDDYVSFLVGEANRKYDVGMEKLERLKTLISGMH